MIILRKPHDDMSKYIGIESADLNKRLQLNRFFPLFWDRETMYYIKSEEIIEFLGKVGVEVD